MSESQNHSVFESQNGFVFETISALQSHLSKVMRLSTAWSCGMRGSMQEAHVGLSRCYKLATVTAAEADLKIRLRERLSDLCFFGFSRDK